MAEDTRALIDALNLGVVHVIGASMGGMISQILAAKYPHKVKSLGLLFTSNNRALLPPPYPKQLLALIGRAPNHDEEVMVQRALHLFQTIGTKSAFDPVKAEAFARKLYRRSFYPVGTLQHYFAVLSTGSLTQLNRQIQAPTVVLHGSADRLLPPAHGRAVAKAIRGACFELIDGMGHDIPDSYAPRLAHRFAAHIHAHI